jgi:hypothetical protein
MSAQRNLLSLSLCRCLQLRLIRSNILAYAISSNPVVPVDKPAGSEESRLEGVQLERMQLGPFPLLRQRLRVGSEIITLVMPSDVDQVLDMYISAGKWECATQTGTRQNHCYHRENTNISHLQFQTIHTSMHRGDSQD